MNTDASYARPRPEPDPVGASSPPTEAELRALARHGDPSLTHTAAVPRSSQASRSIVWMRPSDPVTTATSPMLKRGADTQGNLVRQARRTPSAAARAGRRITRSAIARPAPAAPSEEGLGL
jgi:hypothetical protein